MANRRTPIVFISSTFEDLKDHRTRAKDAAIRARFLPRMMEYFAASGANPPLEACLAKIAGSEAEPPVNVLVVIVADRYGWVPPCQTGAERKSITWLECEEALRGEKEVLAFVVDKDYKWPPELHELHPLNQAMKEGRATPELFAQVQDNVNRLGQFKAWLDSLGIRAKFTTPESLHGEVVAALYDWRDRHPEFRPSAAELAEPTGNPTAYLEALQAQTSHIDIRGLIVGSGKATRLGIDELYIPLKTSLPVKTAESGHPALAEDRQQGPTRVELHEALQQRVLLIVGDPGSGKTTFLRRISNLLCQSLLGTQPEAAKIQLGLSDNPLPLLIRLPDLIEHIAQSRARHDGPTSLDAPLWLAHCLARQSQEGKTGLSEAYFEHRLASGTAMILLDGLDEAPSKQRVQMVKLFENAALAYKTCRFVLTSRPAAFRDEVAMPDCMQVQIDELENDAIQTFLNRWCQALFTSSPQEAESHCRELTESLRAKPEIRRMARNPVMLTALAVVHWNQKRLPEQRADLYESILIWLARAREELPGRPSPERCINLHQELALQMQDDPNGRQVQVGRYEAAGAIAPQWRELPEQDRRPAAEEFLRQDELDSGIVVSRGGEVRFWHLTFQEYLAARALAAREAGEQRDRLLVQPKLYQPDWREAVLLLGGVLHRQGPTRVDAMIAGILDGLGQPAELPAQARCFGLLGAVVRDLGPVGYQPCDPRYRKLQDAVMDIFDPERSKSVDIRVALDAAVALGQAGDPRIVTDLRVHADVEQHPGYVPIPADWYYYGDDKERIVIQKAFWLSRYPVTNSQFVLFLEGGGYEKRRYWSEEGWKWLQAEKFTEPALWNDEKWNTANRPVVGVSYWEAEAFAQWAGGRLPTEREWEAAARGPEDHEYPWGDTWEDGICNSDEAGLGVTSPVGIFPRSRSKPFGLDDMAGNVWEWCQDLWEPGDSPRVIRGGSWYDPARYCRSADRSWLGPGDRIRDLGFRVSQVRSDK